MTLFNENDLQQMGQRIAILRQDMGYSQEEFGDLIGISKNGIGKIERGISNPKADTLISICRGLGVDANSIAPTDVGTDRDREELMTMFSSLKGKGKEQFMMTVRLIYRGLQNE